MKKSGKIYRHPLIKQLLLVQSVFTLHLGFCCGALTFIFSSIYIYIIKFV